MKYQRLLVCPRYAHHSCGVMVCRSTSILMGLWIIIGHDGVLLFGRKPATLRKIDMARSASLAASPASLLLLRSSPWYIFYEVASVSEPRKPYYYVRAPPQYRRGM